MARREYSARELEQKFAQTHDVDEVSAVIEELSAAELQSDERFAQSFIRHRTSQGYGPRKIVFELQQKGIAAGLAQQVLAQEPPDWFFIAQRARRKRFGELPAEGLDLKAKGKQYQYLSRRGFDESHIKSAFDPEIAEFGSRFQ